MLEINTNDKLIDTRQIQNKNRVLQKSIAGILTTLMLFSGSVLGSTDVQAKDLETPPTISQSIDNVSPSTVIEIPEIYQYEIYRLVGKEKGSPITVEDLNSINTLFLTLPISDNSSLEWLNYVGRVEHLLLSLHTDDISVFRSIESLKDIKSISINSAINSNIEINKEDFKFLKNSQNTKSLSVVGIFSVEPGFFEQLTHLKELSILLQDGNNKYDCTKLAFLDKLRLYDPYTAAIHITTEEYRYLVENGVNVIFSNEKELETFLEVSRRLDQIVNRLNVTKDSSDQEKLDAIVCCVLDTLYYDQQVSEALENNQPSDKLVSNFYKGGKLYGALETPTAVCGNYTALTNALAERLDLDSYYLRSNTHAWSLIEVDGKQYYVDTTWLDGQKIAIEQGTDEKYDENGNVISSEVTFVIKTASQAIEAKNTELLEWYMEEPRSYPASKTQPKAHIAINLPSFYGINPQEEDLSNPKPNHTQATDDSQMPDDQEPTDTQVINLDNQDVEIRTGNKSWIVPSVVAVAVLSAVGAIVGVKVKKSREYDYDDEYDSNSDYSNYRRK